MSALPPVDPQAVLQHIKVLSSNKFEGRAPGTRGEDLTVAYLETQFQRPGSPARQPRRDLHPEGARSSASRPPKPAR